MSEFDVSAVDLSGILNTSNEDKAKQLPDPSTYYMLTVVPEAIEEFADKVFFVYRPEYYGFTQNENGESTMNQVELIIAKNNLFTTHIVGLERDTNFTRFDLKPTPQTELTWNYKIEGMNDV